MNLSIIPNLLTILRLILIVPFLMALFAHEYNIALIIFIVAGVTDGLDGFLARYCHWTSRLGSILDPLTDKLLLLCSIGALAILHYLPMWLFAIILIRDIWIILGAILYHIFFGRYHIKPSKISKINTFLQLLMVITNLINIDLFAIPNFLLNFMVILVLLTTLGSLFNYTWTWAKRAFAQRNVRHG